MRRIIPIILTFLLALPQVAFADDPEPESQLLDVDGESGFWFPEETATRMLQDLKKLPLLELKIEKYELRLKLTDTRIELLKEDIELTEEISSKWEDAFNDQFEIAERDRQQHLKELESLKKWYRSPVLWLAVGFIAGGAAAVGLNFGLVKSRGE